MTKEERKEVYEKWVSLANELNRLTEEKKVADQNAEFAFEALKHIDREKAYDAGDEAGWILSDKLDAIISEIKPEIGKLYTILEENHFILDDFESTGAYGLSIKKKVEITFLDGTKKIGLIYPWVYDNAQEMYFTNEEEECIDLGEGWNVFDVELIEIT